MKKGKWFIDPPYYCDMFGYHVIVREQTIHGSIYVADFGTSKHARKNAKETIKSHNKRIK
jgi:hypothetical protein